MASSPECMTWMIVGLTESVVIIALNSLTVIAFCRDRNLRKWSTYLVISLAVADLFDLFDNIGAMCNFWRHNTKYRYRIPAVLLIWFLGCSLTNMTVVSLEHLNATFWPFKHCTIKKLVYWVLIIAIWLTALLFSCALIMIYYYGGLLFLRLDFIHLNLSFTHLTFLFCKASLWKSASIPRRGKQGKETDRDVVHCETLQRQAMGENNSRKSPSGNLWTIPIVAASCYNYFSFFSTNILSSLSEIALFRLVLGSVVLLYAKSFLNPILYTMRMPRFRRAWKMLCRQRPQLHRQVHIIFLREINP